MDKPVLPHLHGMRLFLYGIPDEVAQTRREQILGVTKEDLLEVAEKYILESLKNDKTSKVIFGAKNDDLDVFVSRDWKVERFVDGLSLKPQNYDHTNKEEVDTW